MNTTSSSPAHELNEHAAEFPIRLYTALRTVRLYPPTNPQVIQNTAAAHQAYKTLLDSSAQDDVTIALSEQKIIINGHHLSEKEQARPQIVGLTTFLQQLKLHSLSFKKTFTQEDCSRFISTLATLFGKKEIDKSLSDLLEAANITSVTTDSKRYVVVHEGEQVVSQDQIGFGSGVGISDEEMASFILGQTGVSTPFADSLPKELEPIITIFSEALQGHENPAQLTSAFFNALHEQPEDNSQHLDDVEASANTIANLAPDKLSKLLALLPQTESSNEVLNATIDNLQPKQLNDLVNNLIIDLAKQTPGSPSTGGQSQQHDIIKRLVNTKRGTEIKKTIALNVDARQLLDNPSTTIAELPPHLLDRLRQPDWSAPVLANAVQQAVDHQPGAASTIDPAAVNRMLSHYEQLLDENTQQQVAAKAGAQLAAMGGTELGNVLTQKFKGLFGDKLYHQVVNQVSDDLLDETIENLTPKQLNRMVAMLTSSIPLAIDNNGDPDLTAVDDDMLNKLVQTPKGPMVRQLYSQQVDARALQAAAASGKPAPLSLQKRLQQPQWSAPLLVTAAQLTVDPAIVDEHKAGFEGFNQILTNYDTALSQEQQTQVAAQAGQQLADFEDDELGQMLIHRFKGLFGDKLYTEIIKHLTDEKLATLTQQMYRFVTGQEVLPEGDSNQEVAAAYKRLMQTVKNVKIRTVVEMHKERQQKEAEGKAEKIAKGINAILANDTNQLADQEICQELPNAIIQFIKDGKNIEADTLLMHTAIAIQSTSEKIRLNGAETLALTAQKLAEQKQWDRLVKLLPALEQALQLVVTDESSIKRIITAISQLAHHFLEQNNYAKAFEIVHVINRITSSKVGIEVSETVREHGIAVLDQISSDSILERLLEAYLHDEEKRDNVGNLLTDLGNRSARYQLQYLMNSESRFERKLLLSLIKQTGNAAKDILLEQIQQPSPWYVTRNIVRLLGEIGSPSLVHAIKPFINHKDLRVQQEVLNTAVKLGGNETPEFLKQALSSMDDTIKTKVVHHMGNIPDESYVRPLTELLEQNKSMQGKNKNLFQLAICKTLGIIGSRRALQTLQSVAQSKSVLGITGYADEVRNAAGQTARRIRARLSPDQSPQLPSSSTMKSPNDKQSQPSSHSSSITDQEIHIFKMVEQGKKEEAKEALFDLVTATARAGDFQNAERLRERIYEIDPMALSEIIRSGEIIEQEKTGAINQDDLDTWSQLTDELTSAEFQTIYHELRERIFNPEESIVNQGEKNNELLLINQGSIKASHLINDKEIFITSLGRGEIIGENFFTPSIWTISLTALTQSRIYVLKQDQLGKWKDQFPGLENKLKNFYNKNNKIPSTLKKKGLERRQDERFKISRKIQVQPTDSKGNPIGRGFRADILDISKGGLAFLIRITKKENAKLLLGRGLQIVLPVGGKANYLYLQGLSIGVQPFNVFESDYAVHFKFHDQLDATILQQILG